MRHFNDLWITGNILIRIVNQNLRFILKNVEIATKYLKKREKSEKSTQKKKVQ